jgi:hypothetical protein
MAIVYSITTAPMTTVQPTASPSVPNEREGRSRKARSEEGGDLKAKATGK